MLIRELVLISQECLGVHSFQTDWAIVPYDSMYIDNRIAMYARTERNVKIVG